MGLIMYGGIAYGSAVEGDYGWTDLVGTLTAGQTSLTIQNALITTDKTIEVYTDTFGINPSNVVVTTGQIVLTFASQASDVGVKVRVSGDNLPQPQNGRTLLFESTNMQTPATVGTSYNLSDSIRNYPILEIWSTYPAVSSTGEYAGEYGIDTICPLAFIDDSNCQIAVIGNVRKTKFYANNKRFFIVSFTNTTFTVTSNGAEGEQNIYRPSVWRIYGLR